MLEHVYNSPPKSNKVQPHWHIVRLSNCTKKEIEKLNISVDVLIMISFEGFEKWCAVIREPDERTLVVRVEEVLYCLGIDC